MMQNMHSPEIKTSFAHTCCPRGNVSEQASHGKIECVPLFLRVFVTFQNKIETSTRYCNCMYDI